MIDDAELLQRYAGGSEAAFTEWVGRHLNLVYFTALRRTGQAALAQDIAQAVFAAAAQKAARLAGHPSHTGWLYTTTRHLAERAVRKEQTRRRYELEAAMHELNSSEVSPDWERLRPVIDDVLDQLAARDRDAILLRFFEGRPYTEMGWSWRISPDAARMRVDRALDKLRAQLARRGIESASAAIAIALSTQVSLALPAGLIVAVSGTAMGAVGTTGGAAALLGFMSATKTTLVVATLTTVIATGLSLVERNRARASEAHLDTTRQENVALRARLARAEQQRVQAETRAVEADRDSSKLLDAMATVRAQSGLVPQGSAAAVGLRATSANDPLSRRFQSMFPNEIVAIVGDRNITLDDVRRELGPLIPNLQKSARDPGDYKQRLNRLQNEVVMNLVGRNLLVKEFNNPEENEAPRHVAVAYVDQAFAEILREQFTNDPAKLAAYLESRAMTQAQYRKEIEDNIAYSYMKQQQRKLDQAPTQEMSK